MIAGAIFHPMEGANFRLTVAASHDCNTLDATKEGLFSDGRVVSNLAWLYDRFDPCASRISRCSIPLGIGCLDA
jgi:hypothetical protein